MAYRGVRAYWSRLCPHPVVHLQYSVFIVNSFTRGPWDVPSVKDRTQCIGERPFSFPTLPKTLRPRSLAYSLLWTRSAASLTPSSPPAEVFGRTHVSMALEDHPTLRRVLTALS